MLARWLLFHLASGQACFSGAACLLVAIGLSFSPRKPWLSRARNILIGLGGILIAISGTPLPGSLYVLLFLAILLWLAGESQRSRLAQGWVILLRLVTAIAFLCAVLLELPHHLMPRVPPLGRPTLGIIADSITAGMGEPGTTTWPSILARRHGVDVRDHSRMGATVSSALNQAGAMDPDERLVLLEIGGNDLLGGTRPEDFETGLAALLAAVCRPGRVVVMLELPLPPGSNRFGLIQRDLCQNHNVLLVPKRLLMGVLQQPGTTLDTIHLSPEGHSRMADAVWSVLRGGFEG